jgi:GT2 family glycosyltransferase
MINEFVIGITTFSKRFDYIEKLILQIRNYDNSKILLIINGEKNGFFDNDYRVKILNLCSKYPDVYPIFFIETRGLAKLWNTIIVNSDKDNLLIFNDDIEIHSSEIFDKTYTHINTNKFTGLTKFNGSFSHFIIDKIIIDRIGYFDERLTRAQDYEFNRRISVNGGKVWRNSDIKVFYYNQSNLISF